MLQLELPHINVLSKVDLITQYGELGTFNRILFDMADKVTLKYLPLKTLISTFIQKFKTSRTLKIS